MKTSKVLLVQPPYLRLVGSHNDRIPLELCYLSAYLNNAGFESPVFNADWTGASKYLKWRKLFENFFYLQSAVEGHSPLYDETVERVMSFSPKIVILSAGDNITPWADLGNAYFTAQLSKRLRSLGVYTVGVGLFYTEVPHKFIQSFDTILAGTASPTIVKIVQEMPKGKIIYGTPMDLEQIPLIKKIYPNGRADVVMTALGCPYKCSFCFASKSIYKPIPIEKVIADVANRPAELIDIGDSILPLKISRVKELARLLAPLKKKFTCEVSVESINEKSLKALHELGVVSVKLGMESGDDIHLTQMQKPQVVSRIEKAIELIRRFNFKLTIYLVLGGPNSSFSSAEKTYDLCRRIYADDYVVNVWSYHDLDKRDFRYDAHFSQFLVEKWGLEKIMPDFFDLQKTKKFGLGNLI